MSFGFEHDSEVVETFREESEQHLAEVETGLLALEKNGLSDEATVGSIFRAAHSVKAGAGLLDLKNIEQLAHVLENLLEQFRTGGLEPDSDLITVLLGGVDKLRELIENLEQSDASDISAQLESLRLLSE